MEKEKWKAKWIEVKEKKHRREEEKGQEKNRKEMEAEEKRWEGKEKENKLCASAQDMYITSNILIALLRLFCLLELNSS